MDDKDFRLLPETILAYAAGMFDGEGCVTAMIYNEQGYEKKRFWVDIVNTDRTVVNWLQITFGGMIYEIQPEGNRKLRFTWRLNGELAFEFYQAIYPYSIIKKSQIEMAMYFYRLNRKLVDEHKLVADLIKRERA
jgi:hypothetical protein